MADSSANRNVRRWLTIVVIAVVLYAVLLIVKPMRMPIAWAAFLAFLLQPLQQLWSRKFRSRDAAAGLITALTPIAIFAPLVLVGIAFAQQIADLVRTVQSNPELLDFSAWQDPSQHPSIARLVGLVRERLSYSPEEMQARALESLQEVGKTVAASSGQFFLNLFGTVLRFFLMLFILYFMLRDGQSWFDRATALLPMRPERRIALLDRLAKVTRAVVYGCGLTAAVQGALVGIGFAIASLPGSVVFGVMAGVFALLPFGGAALVWVPATLYLFAAGKIGWAIFMLVWGVIVSVSDNFIRPVIISRYTPVPTLLVFLGVIGGVSAFGPIGFIFGPVILVLATELMRFAEASLARPD
ncbi:AI-2E family transporter [bacterium]|nr:MAG: AI-2E family transporter [bacterium]